MPELPEVEVVRRGLDRWVLGRPIESVEVYNPRAIRRHTAGPLHFAEVLTGRTLRAAHRRGKYLWLPTDGGDALIGHLGMSGQLLVQPTDSPDETHLRVRIRFAGEDRELRFVDQRTFGGLSVEPLPDPEDVPPSIAHIARDPLDPKFDPGAFATALRRKKTGVKRALLDQTLISGVGNIYADEALWRAKLHYARPTETLTGPAIATLLDGVRAVMLEALDQGGTSFDSLYVNVNGESGYFDRSLAAYGREDEPCPRCGTPIRRDAFMNRSSYTCPVCQPKPRRARW
ncbi:bifunctional DNA-formamidopyrimidine glycosylase/DNA-(apurinic or apyrimidinic site) lyase [Cryptosporangium phraense]|uniref:Formamidopyrimidine-DNA glycosylase n=1 Tax=Cryptosporangium phraense TaxID=2593070 RepID=A0A545ASH6_9ACTN|nr:bifunctional DNA-formamidopyrimidine glycosylase/DNA-(apurinic or apyrimidinic site) lyase [Cryptosporangium phraense]TQS44274.1 bifunctional DNA-formamidopyrimidine glycosylase/DNA-(apurinic or apyrimidinic site) lyase [Cryptosporangium phraense]